MLVRESHGREQILDGRERVTQHLLGRLGGVDRANSLGFGTRELAVGPGDGREEVLGLALQPVRPCSALCLSLTAGGGGYLQQQRAIRLNGAGRKLVDRAHLLDSERPSRTLVGQRGIHEAVQKHDGALSQEGFQPLVHELRACGRIQERLGAGRNGERGVFDERANPL